ncbi:LysR substrate-binding domain-containing protein [Nocardia australiensis]|uniref:LysR substrate-binding domain-containing protein n=1 Tax=Nocardia australiensis TaxID=2887191 RepID=UPI001D142B80|nr:LysR substrate-binding domain-containing protein [Nocardia australiensis]
MELRHLRYFRAVAEELHFGRAAERLHIAQPPLSQQIRQLEDELGVRLLNRSTRRVELTPAGIDYLQRTIAILDAVDAAGRHAQQIAEGRRGQLTIGCVGSATYSLLPRLVRALREQLPGVDVGVRGEMSAPAQLTALRVGEIDLALLRPPVEAADVEFETIRSDRLMIALPDGHPLSSSETVDVDELRDADFITHVGHGRSVMNGVLVSLCTAAGFVPRIRHEVEETSTLVTLVAAGLGVAIVPEPTSALGVAGVTYRPLDAEPAEIDLLAARLRDRHSPITTQALDVLRQI